MAEYRPQLGAEEASADIDMTGKTAIVTGGSAGLGIETIRVLAKQGAKAVSVVRNLEKGQNAINSILESVPGADIDLVQLDLFDLESVKKGADVIAAKYPKIDLLINNAGIMAAPLSRTREGLDAHLGTNFLGHFVLTARLIDNVIAAAPARIINLTSSAHRLSPLRFDDPFFEKEEYNKLAAYGQSKTAAVLFTIALDKRFRDRNVRATSVHPGLINTELGRYFSEEEMEFLQDGIPEGVEMKDVSQGAATTVWAATTPEFDKLAGQFCEDCAVADRITDPDEDGRGVLPHALDEQAAERLWQLAQEWSGQTFRD
ncbi:MAG: SDR family NAD(P)-dependent oxidoreductase [Gammaproteobacteria bacterium]|jgi:NAD(P)-dependent dehydrogenase (short-subunit alcohol dehydrogenase family)|nr:SDR family NAD(P)-dependent oxidoreductase [Gammaproteobacteria bacterium]MBT7369945.1 SDR family NAD(P)-dependent oxidoreductase [Gammaproteobacteria bacterium]